MNNIYFVTYYEVLMMLIGVCYIVIESNVVCVFSSYTKADLCFYTTTAEFIPFYRFLHSKRQHFKS